MVDTLNMFAQYVLVIVLILRRMDQSKERKGKGKGKAIKQLHWGGLCKYSINNQINTTLCEQWLVIYKPGVRDISEDNDICSPYLIYNGLH